jgi:hypothetical protein
MSSVSWRCISLEPSRTHQAVNVKFEASFCADRPSFGILDSLNRVDDYAFDLEHFSAIALTRPWSTLYTVRHLLVAFEAGLTSISAVLCDSDMASSQLREPVSEHA